MKNKTEQQQQQQQTYTYYLFLCSLAVKPVRESRVSETHNDSNISPVRKLGDPINIKQFPVSIFRLLQNPAFMCVSIGHAFTGLVSLGLATFLPKYLQNTFDLTASRAAIVAGRCTF